MRQILIVEDNADLARLVRLHLGDLNCRAEIASDGEAALRRLEKSHYDLVILDVMLPGVDGLEVCRRLRSRTDYVPVIMLTSKSGELDRVLGLELGADDYVTKPFSIPELLARIKAQLRRSDAHRSRRSAQNETLVFGHLLIDIGGHRVRRDGEEVMLTAREFELLHHFVAHPGRVFNRSQLLEQIWGYGYEGYEHTVNTHINRLRAKIERDPARPEYILTVWGVGYRCCERPVDVAHAL